MRIVSDIQKGIGFKSRPLDDDTGDTLHFAGITLGSQSLVHSTMQDAEEHIQDVLRRKILDNLFGETLGRLRAMVPGIKNIREHEIRLSLLKEVYGLCRALHGAGDPRDDEDHDIESKLHEIKDSCRSVRTVALVEKFAREEYGLDI